MLQFWSLYARGFGVAWGCCAARLVVGGVRMGLRRRMSGRFGGMPLVLVASLILSLLYGGCFPLARFPPLRLMEGSGHGHGVSADSRGPPFSPGWSDERSGVWASRGITSCGGVGPAAARG